MAFALVLSFATKYVDYQTGYCPDPSPNWTCWSAFAFVCAFAIAQHYCDYSWAKCVFCMANKEREVRAEGASGEEEVVFASWWGAFSDLYGTRGLLGLPNRLEDWDLWLLELSNLWWNSKSMKMSLSSCSCWNSWDFDEWCWQRLKRSKSINIWIFNTCYDFLHSVPLEESRTRNGSIQSLVKKTFLFYGHCLFLALWYDSSKSNRGIKFSH